MNRYQMNEKRGKRDFGITRIILNQCESKILTSDKNQQLSEKNNINRGKKTLILDSEKAQLHIKYIKRKVIMNIHKF